jgi:superoxide dismutase, Cu-Zn family
MKRLAILGVYVFASVAMAKAPAKTKAAAKTATANVDGKTGSTLTGKASFTEKGKEIVFKLDVEKAPAGEHAVHLHEKGDCSAPDAKSAGGHWNPTATPHGQWGHDGHHLGDIGNFTVGADGKGTITLTTDKWSWGTGQPNDIAGKGIIVHEKADDFKTQPTGNAGGRIGCGVVVNPDGTTPAPAASPAPAATKAAPAPAAPAPAKK